MLIRRKRRWEIAERDATPEALWLSRRSVLAGGAAAATMSIGGGALAQRVGDDPTMAAYPYKRNARFTLDRELTPENVASNYNNFTEYGTTKQIARAAQQLEIRPWTVKIDGMVEQPREVDFDTIFAAMPREERLYRLRCVEAWSMALPWSGFPLKALVDYAKPLSSAKYLRFETFMDPKMAPGQRSRLYHWPYVEGITMAEATSELAFIATGVYGKPLPKQFGAPLRLTLPWKYGFKSIKSIVRISFVAERPMGFWEKLQPSEYGFWGNVNPEVSHPRWSQASEEVIGKGDRVKTLLFNGYAEEVAGLYRDIKGERLFV